MNLHNKLKYPDSVVEAARAEIYRPTNDILRVTELIDSPLIKRLAIQHWDELDKDVDDIVYASLFGTAWHKFLAGFQSNAMIEHRWSLNLPDGRLLSGQSDIFKPEEGILDDIKTQSAWAFVLGVKSWEDQLNVYADLIEEHGYNVNELWISAFLRDWSRYEAMKKRGNYPPHKFHRVKVKKWNKEVRKQYIQDRLRIHDNPDYVCSDKERWRTPTKFAVMKEGVKTAKRVLDTRDEAEAWIKAKKPKGEIAIIERRGGCRRCEDWCDVREVCPHREVTKK